MLGKSPMVSLVCFLCEHPICRLDQNSTEEKVCVGEGAVDGWWLAKNKLKIKVKTNYDAKRKRR